MSEVIKKCKYVFLSFCLLFVSCATSSFEDFETSLIKKGYSKIPEDRNTMSSEYNYSMLKNDSTFMPLEFVGDVRKYGNLSVQYRYYFIYWDKIMVNKFVEVYFWDDSRRIGAGYEKENIDYKKGKKIKLKATHVNKETGETVTNPTLYLWD